jgi:hypothetical protein
MTFNAADDFDFELKEEVNANTVDQEDRINKSIARLKKIKELKVVQLIKLKYSFN